MLESYLGMTNVAQTFHPCVVKDIVNVRGQIVESHFVVREIPKGCRVC